MNDLILQQIEVKGSTLYQKNRLKIERLYSKASQLLMIKPIKHRQEVIEFSENVYRKCKHFEVSEKVASLAIQLAEYLEFESENERQRRKVKQ